MSRDRGTRRPRPGRGREGSRHRAPSRSRPPEARGAPDPEVDLEHDRQLHAPLPRAVREQSTARDTVDRDADPSPIAKPEQLRDLRRVGELVGDEDIGDASRGELARFGDRCDGDPGRAQPELQQRQLRDLVRLDVRTNGDAVTTDRVVQLADVGLDAFEVGEDERRVLVFESARAATLGQDVVR